MSEGLSHPENLAVQNDGGWKVVTAPSYIAVAELAETTSVISKWRGADVQVRVFLGLGVVRVADEP